MSYNVMLASLRKGCSHNSLVTCTACFTAVTLAY